MKQSMGLTQSMRLEQKLSPQMVMQMNLLVLPLLDFNAELESLAETLDALPALLSTGGRACVITYHSLEDRIVKTSFKKHSGRCVCPPERPVCDCGRAPLFKILTPKPISPTAGEIRSNSSARSAKIRVVEKM